MRVAIFDLGFSRDWRILGLEDSKHKNVIVAVTSRYFESQDISRQMKACGNNLADRECMSLFA
jgi:hypothetical protein